MFSTTACHDFYARSLKLFHLEAHQIFYFGNCKKVHHHFEDFIFSYLMILHLALLYKILTSHLSSTYRRKILRLFVCVVFSDKILWSHQSVKTDCN